jgi:hypothetical protein
MGPDEADGQSAGQLDDVAGLPGPADRGVTLLQLIGHGLAVDVDHGRLAGVPVIDVEIAGKGRP